MTKKRLVFIHNSLPGEGSAGDLVFKRHFEKLTDWIIDIFVPEHCLNEEVQKSYPDHIKAYAFSFRPKFPLPFRENIQFLFSARVNFWEEDITDRINRSGKKPDAIVTVLYHNYSIAAAQLAKKLDIKLITFLHDRWDVNISNAKASKTPDKIRSKACSTVLNNSSRILTVTSDLVKLYDPAFLSKSEILYPIPSGYRNIKGCWKDAFGAKQKVIYSGMGLMSYLKFYKELGRKLKTNDNDLVITNTSPEASEFLGDQPNIQTLPAFKTSMEALIFLAKEASALLVLYSINKTDSDLSNSSFPSKFIEYTHLEIPIIAVTMVGTPFHSFLRSKNWTLLFDEHNMDSLAEKVEQLKIADFWQACATEAKTLADTVFNSESIQKQFEYNLL